MLGVFYALAFIAPLTSAALQNKCLYELFSHAFASTLPNPIGLTWLAFDDERANYRSVTEHLSYQIVMGVYEGLSHYFFPRPESKFARVIRSMIFLLMLVVHSTLHSFLHHRV
jgi:hypothetical protein